MLTDTTYNALNVLRAVLCGYVVEIEGEKYAYDEESRKIGVLSKVGDETYITYCEINVNRFLSMCEQMDPAKIQEIVSVLQYSESRPPVSPGMGGAAAGQLFH